MGAIELGAMCEERRLERGWSLARVAYEIGLVPPNDKALNESQAKRILEGRRGLDEWMIWRLIRVFDLKPSAAWAAAGRLPKDVDARMLAKLEFFASRDSELTNQIVEMPIPDELGELVRRLRPRPELRLVGALEMAA